MQKPMRKLIESMTVRIKQKPRVYRWKTDSPFSLTTTTLRDNGEGGEGGVIANPIPLSKSPFPPFPFRRLPHFPPPHTLTPHLKSPSYHTVYHIPHTTYTT